MSQNQKPACSMPEKASEYAAKAKECQEAAEKAVTTDLRAAWLSLAMDWLNMVRGRSLTAQSFDDAVDSLGTGQDDSTASH